jgi:hypothetical protein
VVWLRIGDCSVVARAALLRTRYLAFRRFVEETSADLLAISLGGQGGRIDPPTVRNLRGAHEGSRPPDGSSVPCSPLPEREPT